MSWLGDTAIWLVQTAAGKLVEKGAETLVEEARDAYRRRANLPASQGYHYHPPPTPQPDPPPRKPPLRSRP